MPLQSPLQRIYVFCARLIGSLGMAVISAALYIGVVLPLLVFCLLCGVLLVPAVTVRLGWRTIGEKLRGN